MQGLLHPRFTGTLANARVRGIVHAIGDLRLAGLRPDRIMFT